MITVGTDSYVTLAEANAYFDSRPFSTNWTDATDDEKEDALKYATKLIDLRSYTGIRTELSQELAFPRTNMYIDNVYQPSSTVPQRVKDAQCEMALYLTQNDMTEYNDLSEFDRIKVSSIEVETRSGGRDSKGMKRYPPMVLSLLRFALESSSKLKRG